MAQGWKVSHDHPSSSLHGGGGVELVFSLYKLTNTDMCGMVSHSSLAVDQS